MGKLSDPVLFVAKASLGYRELILDQELAIGISCKGKMSPDILWWGLLPTPTG